MPSSNFPSRSESKVGGSTATVLGVGLVLLFAILTRVLLTPASYFDAEDSLNYASAIRAADFQHFDAAGSGWQLLAYLLDQWHGPVGPPTWAGELMAKVAGVVALLALFFVIRDATRSPLWATGWTLLFGSLFCIWWYSLQPDKYVPQLALQASALLLALHMTWTPSWWLRIAFCTVAAVAVTFHTASGLVILAGLPHLILTQRSAGWFALLRVILGMALAFVLPLLAYFVVFIITAVQPTSLQQGLSWVMSYTAAPAEQRVWGHWHANSGLMALIGLGLAAFPVDFIFGTPGLGGTLAAKFPSKILVEELQITALFSREQLWLGLALLGVSVGGVPVRSRRSLAAAQTAPALGCARPCRSANHRVLPDSGNHLLRLVGARKQRVLDFTPGWCGGDSGHQTALTRRAAMGSLGWAGRGDGDDDSERDLWHLAAHPARIRSVAVSRSSNGQGDDRRGSGGGVQLHGRERHDLPGGR